MESREESENLKQKSTTNSNGNADNSKTPFVIKIPSYDEVVGEAETAPNQPPLNPSSSFSEAFNFVKNSEFYTSPPISSTSRQSSAGPTPSVPPIQRPIVQQEVASSSNSAGASRNSILVSHRQKGNPLLKHIRNVRWAFADVVCDYLVGQNACALYLSLRYHLLHPDYLYFRIRELQKNFKLRVVLCHVDVEDVVKPLLEVTKTALLHDCTLLCGWSLEECARYLETIKVYENKSADLIQGQVDMDYLSRLNHALTTVRHVNKTDVVTLGSTFGSLAHVMDASMEDLARCPGIGERKVKRLYDTFHEPFKRVIPTPSTINEIPAENRSRFESQSERHDKDNTEISEDTTSKRRKKGSDVSVRDALKAAFAKCSGKIPRKNSASQLDNDREKTNTTPVKEGGKDEDEAS